MKILHVSTSGASAAGPAAPGPAVQRLHEALRRLRHDSTLLLVSRPSRALARRLPSCDVLNLHDVHDAIDYLRLFRGLPRDVPVVWRLADASRLVGGESQRRWKEVQRSLPHVAGRLHLVATSPGLADALRAEHWLSRWPLSIIPDGTSTEEAAAERHNGQDWPSGEKGAQDEQMVELQARRYESLYKCILPGGRWFNAQGLP